MCCARRVVEDWRWSGCTGSHRSRAPQPAKGSRERNTNKKKTATDILLKAGTYTERGVAWGLREQKLLRGVIFWGEPLCWLLLSCVESAISVLGRGVGGCGRRDYRYTD